MATEVNQTYFSWSQGESTERDGPQVSFYSLFMLCEISSFGLKRENKYNFVLDNFTASSLTTLFCCISLLLLGSICISDT